MAVFNYEKYKPGTRSGMLTILEVLDEKKNGYRLLKCKCDCGKETVMRTQFRGKNKSCGCRRGTKHGMSLSPEYSSWRSILKRCTDKSTPSYEKYGGRGIKVSFKDFDEFYSYMGPRPGKEYTVDRIDNSKGYETGNIRWATMKEQNNNRTNNVKCVINGEEHTLQERADKLGISRHVLKRGILKGRIEGVLFNYKHTGKWY